jgi:CRP-like cAMP-binding protein
MMQVNIEPLHDVSLTEGLDPHHLDKLASLATKVSFERDQIIFREGEAHNKFYIILSGKVALEIRAPSRVFRVQTLQEGDEFGWSALMEQGRRHFEARALRRVPPRPSTGMSSQKLGGSIRNSVSRC